MSDDRPILVTGGAGFIGSNLADRLASDGHRVRVYDALLRSGVEGNLRWLTERHGDRIEPVVADIRDEQVLVDAARDAKAVFHLAAQVAVTTSLDDPRDDFSINIAGTLNLLDALRRRGDGTPLVFASTNKVYGDLTDLDFALENDAYVPVDPAVRGHGIDERRPLDFHTPYGCSKGAADQYVLDYARSFGVPTAVLRMSCIYGRRQMGTEDQGWVAHFLIRALEGKPITLYGDGHQVRDILDVSNAVDAYVQAWRRIDRVSGRAFNLGGGAGNAVSLRRLLAHIGDLTGRDVDVSYSDWRAGDQRYFVADTRLAEAELGLKPKVPWRDGVAALAEWLAGERGLTLRQHAMAS
ncbi:NAD-dependent epimerase/dehydratase family protein [Microvirga sp. SRT01]|uniref:NAD-dependent epimerase/dehydratase family protein n=1 Tax=Sphingomonas longa TaxID=2778730 RepID=A0ABS2D6G0_9SPHN|nr:MULTISPECIES: NAD-dependent epimerase/dehydratase family protein [Alphaproteobacteria]MBM6576512.1 NAD-dependent epimerase/dehydratase family protein [Sphingomonas sp. BT552]MBR7709558.1 NAD-dependent epimerase/dehydratase family protein [Microvirga sp. SRT01]